VVCDTVRMSLTGEELLALADRLSARGREVLRESSNASDPDAAAGGATRARTLTILAQNLRDGVTIPLTADFDDFVTRCARNYQRLGDHWAAQTRTGASASTPARAAGMAAAYAEAVAAIGSLPAAT
jgi:hypothetical protein